MNARHVTWRRGAGLIAAALLIMAPLPAQAIPAPWPGLPAVPPSAQWYGIQGNGFSEAARAQQWIQIPSQAIAFANTTTYTTFPPDDPQHRQFIVHNRPLLFLSSPAGDRYGYGVGLPVTVQTVAFGAIPVQARVQLAQVRDAAGLPEPLMGDGIEDSWTTPQQVRPGFTSTDRTRSVHLIGAVVLRVLDLSADGVALRLRSDCQTAPISIDLDGAPDWEGDPLSDPRAQDPIPTLGTASANWMAARGEGTVGQGGAVSGTVAIPAFRGCRTAAGEDVSQLLTASISGPGNQVSVGFPPMKGFACSSAIPPLNFLGTRKPFAGDPSDCDPAFAPPTFHYPARPR